MDRRFGIILPVYSIPSRYGIGSLGKEAYSFVDFLSKSGVGLWQVLPLGPTSYGDSPYQCFSAFAGNDYFIDLDKLKDEGLLTEADLAGADDGWDPQFVDYGRIYSTRYEILEKASERFFSSPDEDYFKFTESVSWLEDYALYMAIKRSFGMVAWTEWPEEYRDRRPEIIEAFREEHEDMLRHHRFCQYKFFSQWKALLRYAHRNGIEVVGDAPIYVSMDSADVWSNRDLFCLDEKGYPTVVAGVPPDYFSETGQLWGNPIYRWDEQKDRVYEWWERRVSSASILYDYLRIDHFRGFDSYWTIPADEETAINGEWVEGPGIGFIRFLKNAAGNMKLIAEDLGLLTPSVKALLRDSRLPGMKVLEFAFSGEGESDYLPEAYHVNCICYTGTHDNDPVCPWLDSLDEQSLEFFSEYMKKKGLTPDADGMIRLGLSSEARFFIVQMQDLLETGSGSRTNLPGVQEGNWRWRLTADAITEALSDRIMSLVKEYGRI